jgi:hypothetical protein
MNAEDQRQCARGKQVLGSLYVTLTLTHYRELAHQHNSGLPPQVLITYRRAPNLGALLSRSDPLPLIPNPNIREIRSRFVAHVPFPPPRGRYVPDPTRGHNVDFLPRNLVHTGWRRTSALSQMRPDAPLRSIVPPAPRPEEQEPSTEEEDSEIEALLDLAI